MLNTYLRRVSWGLAALAFCVMSGTAHAQQRALSDAERAYLEAQKGKPLPPKPGQPVVQRPTWVAPASCFTLRPSKILCTNPKREILVNKYVPVLIMDESSLDPIRVASRACEKVVADIWNDYVNLNACKEGFGPNRMNSMASDFVELTVMAGICRQPNPPKNVEGVFIENLVNQWNCFLDGTCATKPAK